MEPDINDEPGDETADMLPWREFFEGAGFPEAYNELGKSVELHPGLNALAQLLPQVPVLMVQAYLKAVLLLSTETFLGTDFLRTNFNWRVKMYVLANPDEPGVPPEWTVSDVSTLPEDYTDSVCQDDISSMVPFLVGKYFSDKIFDVESQKMAVSILNGVRSGLRYGLKNEEHWMDRETRAHALEKLDKMVDKIGYPNMHTAGEGQEDSRVRSDLNLLELVDKLYVKEVHASTELLNVQAQPHRHPGQTQPHSGHRLKSPKEVDEPGPLALPLRLPAHLRAKKSTYPRRMAHLAQYTEQYSEPAPRKHYSQQQMQMGGFPPEAYQQPAQQDAAPQQNGQNGQNGGNGQSGGKPPFHIDDETNILPHETPDPPELFAHYYGYFGKSMATANFDFRREMKKIGQKVDRSEWFMSPQTVNAYYSPAWNEMVFPVAILQPPFFFKAFHPAMNFGSIGAIMGHEMTHGFDVSGRKFDKDGNEVDWWKKQALETFLERAQCVSDFYSNYTEYGVNLNGEAECGENIADMGGVKFAFRGMKAYMKAAQAEGKTFPQPPNGLTPEQLYFVSYGQTWCTKSDKEYLLMLNAQDEHSLPRERVNGPLTNTPDFHEAFSCPVGSPMNPSPAKQCRMW